MINNIKKYFKYILVFSVIGVILFYLYQFYYNPETALVLQKEKVVEDITREEILKIINENVDFDKNLLPDNLKVKVQSKSLDDLINEALSDSKKDDNVDEKENISNDEVILDTKNVFSNIEMISTDVFECDYEGKRRKFRLIGIKSGSGNMKYIQDLLENVSDVNIEFDNVKVNSNGEELIYLWDGEAKEDKSNLINLQIILNKFGTTTYINTADLTQEVPNNKYATTFIKYQKFINNQ